MCNDLTGVELILMDGGSSDDTQDIVEHYIHLFAHTEFKKDRGQSHAINKGFARATQPILYWLNGDDLILPNALTRARRAFVDNPDTDVIVGDAYMVEKNLTVIRHAIYSDETLRFEHLIDYAANHLIQPSVFFNRKAWDLAGPLGEDQHYAMDADLFLGMARQCTFTHLPVDIAYSVYHEDCKTRLSRAESITELALVQASHGGFDQARKSLNIIVDMYNATQTEDPADAANAELSAESTAIGNLAAKARAQGYARNKRLLRRSNQASSS